MNNKEKAETAFEAIRHGMDILWEIGYDYDTVDLLQSIIDHYDEQERK